MKILIVDDEQAIVKMYQEALTSAGYEVVAAAAGPEALEILKKDKVDLVLLDIIMPKLNGLDVLKTIKETPETKDVPVILLTNLPEENAGDKAKELGGAGYLVKAQTEPRQLVEEVKKIIS